MRFSAIFISVWCLCAFGLYSYGQARPDDTNVYRMTLSGITGEVSVNGALSVLYETDILIIESDSTLRLELIDVFLTEAYGYGYKIPDSVWVVSDRSPYEFILDLPIGFNRLGYMVSAKHCRKQMKRYYAHGKVIGDHPEKTVFDFSEYIVNQ